MFYALPAETVFEAKERTRRATFYLFSLLLLLYIFFSNLLLALCCGLMKLRTGPHFHFQIGNLATPTPGWEMIPWFSLLAALVGALHFYYIRGKGLEELLVQIKAGPADPQDEVHAQFIHLVEEVEGATGIHNIRPVVISTPGLNAFSLQDGHRQCAIGVTEGLLSKLNRSELSAVVAHEAAHLVHEDSRLVTTACFLFGIFGGINQALGDSLKGYTDTKWGRRSSLFGDWSVFILLLWVVSGISYGVTKLISMAISREREYLADSDGVALCKDPFAMAEGLYKISHRYRGSLPDTYSALFIMNPRESGMDEKEGLASELFSNHPPVSKRLSRLLRWANSDLERLEKADQRGNPEGVPGVPPAGEEKVFRTYQDNQWVGPYSSQQLLTLGSVTPATWICPLGSQEVVRASEVPELLVLFQQQIQGIVSKNHCPRCKVSLLTTLYEGAQVEQCSFCKGYLLRSGVLERLISREERVYSLQEIQKATLWRDSQVGPLKDRDPYPEILCPYCGEKMGKGVHSVLTQVVIDHCTNESCGAVWCDGGELETIQMLIEEAHSYLDKVS